MQNGLKTSRYVVVFWTFRTTTPRYTDATQNSHPYQPVPTMYRFQSDLLPDKGST